ncbi:BEN domain-containing protein 5-like [Ornithodoros turicata]|uniref:BEN domain-containing protein 5-like n=1 Tax=Ornithodoros turicata TaxID=34597 RepID=UPI0031395E4E
MFAHVMYTDKAEAIVPVSLIRNFNPKDVTDFDSTLKKTFWQGPDEAHGKFYKAEVLKLGETKEDLLSDMINLGLCIPAVIEGPYVPPQEKPVVKQPPLAMSQHKGSVAQPDLQASCSCHKMTCSKEAVAPGTSPVAVEVLEDAKDDVQSIQLSGPSTTIVESAVPFDHEVLASTPCLESAAPSPLPSLPIEEHCFEESQGTSGTVSDMKKKKESPNDGSDTEYNSDVDFPVKDGRVILSDGVTMKKDRYEWVMASRSDSKFCKDVVRTIWSTDELMHRSVTGAACRRTKDAQANRALTPKKLSAAKKCAKFRWHMKMHFCSKNLPEN